MCRPKCPIEPSRVDGKYLYLPESVHYAWKQLIRLFKNIYSEEFEATEAMCCDKRHQVA
jgi:hypothetical protein